MENRENSAKRLKPFQSPQHSRPQLRLDGWSLSVRFTKRAYSWLSILIELAREEVNFIATAVLDPSTGDVVVDEVFVLPQTVSSSATEFSARNLDLLIQELRRERPEEWRKLNQSLRFLFHSHGSGGVFESAPDKKTILGFSNPVIPLGPDWFLSAIGNKSGELKINFYLFPGNSGLGRTGAIVLEGVPWSVEGEELEVDESLRKVIEAEYKRQITEQSAPHIGEIFGAYTYLGYGVPWGVDACGSEAESQGAETPSDEDRGEGA